MTDLSQPPIASRRAVLAGAGAGALALCLGGCVAAGDRPTVSSAPSGTALDVADVPVGGGTIVDGFVVTQPTEGTFAAFSYLCTHQALPVQQVTDAAIVCGRHGSSYSLADGSVLTGPATRPLAPATVTRTADTLAIN